MGFHPSKLLFFLLFVILGVLHAKEVKAEISDEDDEDYYYDDDYVITEDDEAEDEEEAAIKNANEFPIKILFINKRFNASSCIIETIF